MIVQDHAMQKNYQKKKKKDKKYSHEFFFRLFVKHLRKLKR